MNLVESQCACGEYTACIHTLTLNSSKSHAVPRKSTAFRGPGHSGNGERPFVHPRPCVCIWFVWLVSFFTTRHSVFVWLCGAHFPSFSRAIGLKRSDGNSHSATLNMEKCGETLSGNRWSSFSSAKSLVRLYYLLIYWPEFHSFYVVFRGIFHGKPHLWIDHFTLCKDYEHWYLSKFTSSNLEFSDRQFGDRHQKRFKKKKPSANFRLFRVKKFRCDSRK